MKPLRTWALIADGARARILENTGPIHGDSHRGSLGHGETAHDWMAVEGLVFHGDHSATHDLVTDRQGRSFSSTGAGRSAIEAKTDPHRDQKTKFAFHLAEVLSEQLKAGAYQRLIIAAPPATLGDLRSAISDEVRRTIVAEVGHDLTKVPNHEIGSHLKLALT
jgi:protein required for attachment to host cells